jgi:hypothetical protein
LRNDFDLAGKHVGNSNLTQTVGLEPKTLRVAQGMNSDLANANGLPLRIDNVQLQTAVNSHALLHKFGLCKYAQGKPQGRQKQKQSKPSQSLMMVWL